MLAGLLVLLAAACAPADPAPVIVTATLLPRTSTPLPTETPLPTPTPQPTDIPPTPTPAPPSIAQELARLDSFRMLTTIDRLVAFGNRHILAPPAPDTGIQAARAYLMGQMLAIQQTNAALPIEVFRQPFGFTWSGQSVSVDNVVMVLHGTDPAAGVIVVGAHYDTIGTTPSDLEAPQPGANDNASGVAVVLELARVLAGRPRPETLVFVLFAAEEQGRYGSLAFVQALIPARGWDVRAMINLDMVGSPSGPDGDNQPDVVRLYSAPPQDSPSRRLAQQVAAAAETHVPQMRVTLYDALDREGRWGDHQSFSDAGYPAVRLIQPFDDPARMHNETDLPDGIDLTYLQRVAQVTLAAVLSLSAA